ncbi:aldolase/citrate lyase family protein [Halomonas heilongjiangensis]|uniref:Aldolase n=1 Tax=Halomonas heilongjiangensis TaxID=1387883 RepID=A0A2N7TUJ8_9GAMM|nr:aldolase/citrate lyase family protein [Halomonas heilongjiangensis]PMR71859.1 aldolase [Halomonas heilongjiangensis]PXX87678.1 aldolase [Halomonas heilongjiangensis]
MKHLHFKMITAMPEVARHAEACGVDTIFIDMEIRGKSERQGHLDTQKSEHTTNDISRIARVLTRAELMARINPPWEGTAAEVEAAIAAGAGRLMLPMFRTCDEVAEFKSAVAGRVPVTLLVETASGLARLPVILPLLQVGDRVHFGLNDLCIDMGLDFLFEVLGGRLLDGPAALCRDAGVPFGIGGVGRIGMGDVPADWIISEHVRLGSEWVILSRAFHGGATSLDRLVDQLDLAAELSAIHQCYRDLGAADSTLLREYQRRLACKAAEIGRQRSSARWLQAS